MSLRPAQQGQRRLRLTERQPVAGMILDDGHDHVRLERAHAQQIGNAQETLAPLGRQRGPLKLRVRMRREHPARISRLEALIGCGCLVLPYNRLAGGLLVHPRRERVGIVTGNESKIGLRNG